MVAKCNKQYRVYRGHIIIILNFDHYDDYDDYDDCDDYNINCNCMIITSIDVIITST